MPMSKLQTVDLTRDTSFAEESIALNISKTLLSSEKVSHFDSDCGVL